MREITVNSEHDKRMSQFLAELTDSIKSHRRRRKWDSGLYQFLVIGAASAGFLSLYVGTVQGSAVWAGVIGALTSVATILSQQLHCVKAISWHERMATELDGIRLQLVYECNSAPDVDQLAEFSTQLRNVKLKMTAEWEKVTSAQSARLGGISLRKPGKD
jgi:hypothetical protein